MRRIETVNEYDLAELAMEAQSTVTAVFALYLTVLSGYLFAAWIVGRNLTRLQLVMINTLFIGVQLSLLFGWTARWNWFWYYYNQAKAINPAVVPDASLAPYLIFFTGALLFLSMVGAIKFMWDIRHHRTE